MLALVFPKKPPGGCQGTDRGRALPEVTQHQSLVLGDSQMGGRTGHFSEQVPSCRPLTETSGLELGWPWGRSLLRQIPERGWRACQGLAEMGSHSRLLWEEAACGLGRVSTSLSHSCVPGQ